MTVPAGIGLEAKTRRPGYTKRGVSEREYKRARIHHVAQTFGCVGDEDKSVGPSVEECLDREAPAHVAFGFDKETNPPCRGIP
jgi:hypothetical protein